ncbi:MAG: 2-succinyl-6-hydroxy-2,4-cyclohexadiene-1-carboxylate synthase [Bacteroidota bacterium]|nr:2-succinyl-6-hydroxy-2,4-cyclohexadiene-1-carboxylate synthase [Bacteroidota bacterium]
MIIDNVNIELTHYNELKKDRPAILFLHGFTGSACDWNIIAEELKKEDCNLIGIDLPGHGKSSSPDSIEYYRLPFLIKIVKSVITNLPQQKITLAGYSMGGRLALAYAAQYPDDIFKLILESTSPGLADPLERLNRIESDRKVINILEEKPIDEFVDYWMNIPLFATQRKYKTKLMELRERKLLNSPIGLVNSLKGFGTGVMPPQYENLKNISSPVLLITGSLDTKFTEINKDIVSAFPDARHIIIEGAGHNVHFEKPEEYALTVSS